MLCSHAKKMAFKCNWILKLSFMPICGKYQFWLLFYYKLYAMRIASCQKPRIKKKHSRMKWISRMCVRDNKPNNRWDLVALSNAFRMPTIFFFFWESKYINGKCAKDKNAEINEMKNCWVVCAKFPYWLKSLHGKWQKKIQ